MKINLFLIILAIFFLYLIVSDKNDDDKYKVTRIVDGDTLEINHDYRIRLIGIDTPELGEHGYFDAKLFLDDLILGKNVTLVKDVQDKDIYSRNLRYIYYNNVFVNMELIKNCLAKPMYVPPNGRYATDFDEQYNINCK